MACFRCASILLKKKKKKAALKIRNVLEGFPDGLVVIIPHFIKGSTGSPIPGQGTKIPHAAKR